MTSQLDELLDTELSSFVAPSRASGETWPNLATELQHYIGGRCPLDRVTGSQRWVLDMMQLHTFNRKGRVMQESNESPLSETPAFVHLTMVTAGFDDELTEVFLVEYVIANARKMVSLWTTGKFPEVS